MDTTTATGGNEIQLSITKNYAGHWETWEGVREMVQNWHDGLYSSAPNVHISDDELKFKKVIKTAQVQPSYKFDVINFHNTKLSLVLYSKKSLLSFSTSLCVSK